MSDITIQTYSLTKDNGSHFVSSNEFGFAQTPPSSSDPNPIRTLYLTRPNGKLFEVASDQCVIFLVKKNFNAKDLGKTIGKLWTGFSSNELMALSSTKSKIGSYSSTYFRTFTTADTKWNSAIKVGGTVERWVHRLTAEEYATIYSKAQISKLSLIAIDGTGHYVCIPLNEQFNILKLHRATEIAVKSATTDNISSVLNLSSWGNRTGFFYGHAYLNNGERITKKTFFVYNTSNYRQVDKAVSSSSKALTIFNRDRTFYRIAECCDEIQGKYYKDRTDLMNFEEEDSTATEDDLASQVLNGIAAALTEMDEKASAPVFSTGDTTEAPIYIDNIGSYKLKIAKGQDKRTGKTASNNIIINKSLDNPRNLYLLIENEVAISLLSEYEITAATSQDSSPIASLTELGNIIDTYQLHYSTIDFTKYPYKYIQPKYKVYVKNGNTSISLENYFNLSPSEKEKYQFIYYELSIDNGRIIETKTDLNSFYEFISANNPYWEIVEKAHLDVQFEINDQNVQTSFNLVSLEFFEAYTRGRDFIQKSYTTVRPQETSSGKRLMDYNDNYFIYKYSGRNFDLGNNTYALVHEKDLLLETDVTLGDTYGKQTYFIEAIKFLKNKVYTYEDTFKAKNLLDIIDSTQYTEDDYKVIDNIIDLNACEYYKPELATYSNHWCDCCYGGTADKECVYQKLGICPYRFQTEKHPRRIRTLEQSKSNRFNLIQETSKVFEIYPQFYIEYEDNGKIKLNDNGQMKKHIYFITEKGSDKYAGFRYEKNLSNISRTVDSSAITTKLFVETVDSDLTNTGVCSIQTAEDNIGRNAYILDFSYYTKKGLLNAEQVQRDVWGIDGTDLTFLPTIGVYNKQYDELTNLIISLTNETMTELKAKNDVAITGITTALEERKKIAQRMYQFKQATSKLTSSDNIIIEEEYTLSDTYISYLNKYREQATILFGLVEDLFFTNDYFMLVTIDELTGLPQITKRQLSQYSNYLKTYCAGELWWKLEIEGLNGNSGYFDSWNDFKEKVIDTNSYSLTGNLGQYTDFYNQVQYWKKERAKVLNKINNLSEKFYKRYEPYIKEGTWTDNNYLTDNEYYWAACDVLNDSSSPKIQYSINVIDISPLEEFEDDYTYDLADTTYLEDIDFFGVSQITGLPNREKVLISAYEEGLDDSFSNSITVQNYSTQFEDLFETITASVQSLTYNENTYKRASNFTAKQYIQSDSLQGTLSQGNLTLVDSNNSNIVLDDSGTQGNDISNSASKYKLSGEGLYFSTDGGETWDIGVGPKGWNLDYAKFGQLDTSKIQIVDGKYIYFLWDTSGINAYRNPSTSTNGLNDFARFNRYGLSLVENGHIRLRAGYEFRNNENGDNYSGDYNSELDLTNQNIGFYLYNDSGSPIFKTETASEYNDSSTDYSARLSLKGEMFITNTNLSNNRSQTGQAIGFNTGTKFTQGYLFTNQIAGELIDNIHGAAIQNNYIYYASIDNTNIIDTITLQPDEEFNGNIYYRKSNTNGNSMYIISNDKLIEVTPRQYEIEELICTLKNNSENELILTLNAETYTNIKADNIEDCEIAYSSSDISVTIYNNKMVSNTSVIALSQFDAAAEYITDTSITAPKYSITYYDLNLNKQTAELYFYTATFGSTTYNYWGSTDSQEVETASSNIETNTVGIFINNKLSVNNNSMVTTDDQNVTINVANQGNERIFMIALKGYEDNVPVFRNILSVLKNGMLYIGGEVKNELGGSLNNITFDTMPDRIRITNASMIVANNGYTWLDWDKTFNIRNGKLMKGDGYSLYDLLEKASSGSGSDESGTGNVAIDGYYLVEPLEEI